jgi:gliding motility-associated-like protein
MKHIFLFFFYSLSHLITWMAEPSHNGLSNAPTGTVFCNVLDSLSLVAFYDQTNNSACPPGPIGWDVPWNLNNNVCTWPGVTLNSAGRVIILELQNNGLTGNIPPELSTLTALQQLILSNNCLTGPIPPELGDLTSVSLFFLDGNDLTGTIPDEICNLINVSAMFLDENNLTGAVPVCFNNLDQLSQLDLFENCIDSLPNLNGMLNLGPGKLRVQNNKLTFDDILPNSSDIGSFYNPQDSFCVPLTITLQTGTTYNLDLGIDEGIPNNVYQWFRNGVPFGAPTNSNTLVFNPVTFASAGVYHCRVTNPSAPLLTLRSRAKTINVVCGTSVFTFTPDVCSGYEIVIGGETYNEANPCDNVTLDNADQFGCDSIVNICLNFVTTSPTPLDSTLCPGESITVNGKVYNQGNPTGIEMFGVPDQFNCDSTVAVSLSFFPVAESFLTPTICTDGSITIAGQTFNASNPSGEIILNNASFHGCDSTIHVDVNFFPVASSTLTGDYCDGQQIVVNGTTYNSSNPDGMETINNGSWRGCDSIVTVDLTFGLGVVFNLNQSICEGQEIIVNGETYDCDNPTGQELIVGGSYTNCDSTINVNLSCYQPPNGVLNMTICFGDEFIYNGTIYDENNDEGIENLGNIGFNGCDSIVEVNLNFFPPSFSVLDTSLCSNEILIVAGVTVINNNPVVLQNASYRGCDSTIYINRTNLPIASFLIDDVFCPGGSITVNGEVYDENNLTGTETFFGAAFNGCDSIVTIDISYGTEVINQIDIALCDGETYTLPGGIVLDQNNPTYSETLIGGSYNNCDSITIHTVSYYPVSQSQFNPELCPGESVVIGGVIIDAANLSDTILLANASYTGCDSTLTVNAIVYTVPDGDYINTLCDGESIVINGTTYNEANPSGVETIPNGSFHNCDTTFTVLIDFYPASTSTLSYNLCQGESVIIGGVELNATSPFATITLPGVGQYGCDSIIMASVSYYPPATSTIDNTLCFGQSIVVNGTIYNEANPAGTEILTDMSYHGCDSIVTIDLSFNSSVMVTFDDIFCDHTEEIIVNGTIYNILNPAGMETMTSVSGCDSIATIDLTYPDSVFVYHNDVLCPGESIVVNGVTYDANTPNGTEVQIGAAPFGCDIYHIVNLSFYQPSESNVNETLCFGDDIVIAGTLFNASHLTDIIVLPNAAYNNCDSIVIVAIDFYPEIITNLNNSLCEGQSIQVNGNIYDINTTAGTEVMTSYMGCDSTIFINLNFSGVVLSNYTDILCEGESVTINGTVYDMNNPMGSDTFPNGSYTGCDSILNVSITFIPRSYHPIDTTLCPGEFLIVNNVVYDANNLSGIETISGGSYNDCDSIINVTLQYFPDAIGQVDTILCAGDIFVWDGMSYPVSTMFNDTIIGGSYTGCDSIVLFSVDYYELAIFQLDTMLCEGEELVLHGITFDENNMEGDIILNGLSYIGCDSTIQVSLGFHPLSGSTEAVTICEGESFAWNGQQLTLTGMYQHTLAGMSFYGCDSISMLDLTVLSAEALGLADAGEDLNLCGSELTLNANLPNGSSSGQWTILSGNANLNNATLPDATLNQSGITDIVLVWTLSTALCPNYDKDSIFINVGILPDAVDDEYLGEEGAMSVSISILDNDLYDNIEDWDFNIVEFPGGDLQVLGDGQFLYTAPTDLAGGLIVFPYELCNEECPEACDTAMVRIQLQEEINLDFPNTITANGDGLNDFFIVPELADFPDQFDKQELIVFNRWGDIVYSSKPYQNDWDGTTDGGKELPQGTYYYVLRLDIGQGIIYRGDVTILR